MVAAQADIPVMAVMAQTLTAPPVLLALAAGVAAAQEIDRPLVLQLPLALAVAVALICLAQAQTGLVALILAGEAQGPSATYQAALT